MPGIRPLSAWLGTPALPGFACPKTYAAWPVWSGSTTKEIKFQGMPKKAATRLWHRARDFDRQTRQAGKHGGAVGHTALQVLHALLFDFLNYATGRLDPSQAAIARKANVCPRTVANAIKRLRDLGILNWVRRCAESWKDGRFVLEQVENSTIAGPIARVRLSAWKIGEKRNQGGSRLTLISVRRDPQIQAESNDNSMPYERWRGGFQNAAGFQGCFSSDLLPSFNGSADPCVADLGKE